MKSERDQIGIILGEPRRIAGEYWYLVFFGSGNQRNIPESNIELYEGGQDIESLLLEGVYATKETLSKLITFTKIKHPLRNNIYSIRASRIEFHEYQFKPLLKFLDSPDQRLLLADEVGLGKTIEAGLILVEQMVRHPLERVLIVCPAALCQKWQMEMKHKFGEEFEILSADDIRHFLQSLYIRENEEGDFRFRGICSLQALRGRQFMEEWEAASPPLDLVIIDEAHHLRNPETLSHRMGRILSETADAMLLLTATPIHLGNQDLFYLLRILDPEEFDNFEIFHRRLRWNEPIIKTLHVLQASYPPDLESCLRTLQRVTLGDERERFLRNPIYQEVVRRLRESDGRNREEIIALQRDITSLSLLSHILTRTHKREVQVGAKREPKVIRPSLTQEEMDFYKAITDLVRSRYERFNMGSFGAFACIMPQRQVASCIPAMVEYYTETLRADIGGLDKELSDMVTEDWDEAAPSELDEVQEYHRALVELIRSAQNLRGVDTKFNALILSLREIDKAEPGRKIIIFSYFKRTLEYLSRRLTSYGYPNLVISGDYPQDERQKRIDDFREKPEIRMLLSSEVGSEGLDFQFCHIMINYDLPWNPMVVEQRIGRLDRFGQGSERIIIFNFSIPGTIEDRILHRLYNRIKIFEESIGDLEAILGEEVRALTHDLLRSRLTPEEQEERIQRAADVIVQRKQELEELEAQSSKFIGHDEFFSDEIRRVQQKKRFISPEEVKTFITEFLNKHFPRCFLRPGKGPGQFYLTISLEFEHFIRDNIPSGDTRLPPFLRRIRRGEVAVTFENEIALQHRELEFITIHHPLFRAIIRYYESHQDEMHPVARVRLETDSFPAGDFLYFIYLLEVRAARADLKLEPIFISIIGEDPLGEDICEELLAAMMTSGKTLGEMPNLTREKVDRVRNLAEGVFGDRIQRLRQDLERTNTALVNNRLASLEQSFNLKIERKERLLEKALERRADTRYIRMLEGGLRNLRNEYKRKQSEIEQGRTVNLSFRLIAVGFLRVCRV